MGRFYELQLQNLKAWMLELIFMNIIEEQNTSEDIYKALQYFLQEKLWEQIESIP